MAATTAASDTAPMMPPATQGASPRGVPRLPSLLGRDSVDEGGLPPSRPGRLANDASGAGSR